MPRNLSKNGSGQLYKPKTVLQSTEKCKKKTIITKYVKKDSKIVTEDDEIIAGWKQYNTSKNY